MREWSETVLGKVAQIVGGGTPSTKQSSYWGDEISWLTPGEVSKQEGCVIEVTQRSITTDGLANSSAKLLPKGAVLLTSRATVGAVAIAGREMATNQGFQSLVPGEKVLPRFLMYWVQANRDEFQSRASGSTFPEISGKKVAAIPILLPPLGDQRRIVDLVGSADSLIAALSVEVAAIRRIYGNSAGLLWQESNGLPAQRRLLSEVMTLDVRRVAVEAGVVYPLAGVLNAGKGVVSKGLLRGEDTGYTALNRLSEDQVVMRKLTAWEGPIAVVTSPHDGFHASNEFPTFALGAEVVPSYFAHVCRSPRLWNEMKHRVTGSVQRRKRLSPEQLLSVALPIPDLVSQKRIADALDAVFEAWRTTQHEVDALRRSRMSLLTNLMTQGITLPGTYDRLLEVS